MKLEFEVLFNNLLTDIKHFGPVCMLTCLFLVFLDQVFYPVQGRLLHLELLVSPEFKPVLMGTL